MDAEREIELLTPAEVDRLLRWPRGRAAKAAVKKALPAIRLPGGELRFDRAELWRFLVACGVEGKRR